MNCDEILKVIEALRVSGAVRFKTPGLEVDFGNEAKPAPAPVPQTTGYMQNNVPPPPGVTQSQAQANTQRIQQLIDLLKKNDEQLADEIFPAGA